MKTKMSEEEKINYMRIGLALCGIGADLKTTDLIIKIYEETLEKGGDFSIKDAVRIEHFIHDKYKPKQVVAEKNDKSHKK